MNGLRKRKKVKAFNFLRLRFPASRGPFFLCIRCADGREEKGPLPWVETLFDSTAVHDRGRRFPKRMLPVVFADRDLSPLYLAHSFTVIPLSFSEPA